MEPTPLSPVVPGVRRWSIWNEPRKLWFNAHVLDVGGTTVAIDPVPMSEAVLRAVEVAPPSLCVITNRDHRRDAATLRARFGARLLVPRADAAQLELDADELLDDGATIAGALRVVAVASAKTSGELALHWPERRLLVLGDAAVGRPAGALSMLPDEKFADPVAARAGVARLATLDVDIVLVGDGDDLVTGGAAALAALAPGPARAPVSGAGGC